MRSQLFGMLLLLLCAGTWPAQGQPAPDTSGAERTFRPVRFWGGLGGFVAVDVPVMYALTTVWYDEGSRTSFHWYSDSENATGGGRYDHGWLDDWYTYVQQDKLGHVWTGWHLARAFGAYGRWSGLSNGKAALFGGVMSTLFQTQIEIYDGFHEDYGASRTDLLANLVGAAVGGLKVAYPERLDWFAAKYSYHRSPYYNENASYLGNAIKDYDGISFWLAVRPEELLHGRAGQLWPDWLALSVGYSGDGLAHEISGLGGTPEHRRQLFIGPDLDLLHWAAERAPEPWATLADLFAFLRPPAPALQLTPEVRWYWVFY